MFVKVHKPLKLSGGDNKGSSTNLMEYLDKENEGKEFADQEQFFNDDKDNITKFKAQNIIDNNSIGLKKTDVKFYMFSINPSWREQQHLEQLVSKQFKQEFDKSNPLHTKALENHLKDYSKDIMNVYANAFTRRDEKGNEVQLTSKDIVYTAKVETQRSFKIWDKEVQENNKIDKEINKLKELLSDSKSEAKTYTVQDKIKELEKNYIRQNAEGVLQKESGNIVRGNLAKEGRNNHVHVVVGRQTSSKWYRGERIIDGSGKVLINDEEKIKKARPITLSPQSNSKGTSEKHKLNGKSVSVGFNHEKFKKEAGEKFNQKFNYKPLDKEQYQSKSQSNVLSSSADKIKGKVEGRIKGKIAQEIRGEVAKTEERIVKSVTSTKASLKSNIKAVIKDILKGGALEK